MSPLNPHVKPHSAELTRFGEKLLALRHHRNMTLKELADALGYAAHGYLSELEQGKKKPTTSLVVRLSRFFAVSTDQLLKDELSLDIPQDARGTRWQLWR
jgi:transcriptional regulator with XRE-family HTH domain